MSHATDSHRGHARRTVTQHVDVLSVPRSAKCSSASGGGVIFSLDLFPWVAVELDFFCCFF